MSEKYIYGLLESIAFACGILLSRYLVDWLYGPYNSLSNKKLKYQFALFLLVITIGSVFALIVRLILQDN